jgi:cobalt-zinc-cadmium efflux system outer membrane protein
MSENPCRARRAPATTIIGSSRVAGPLVVLLLAVPLPARADQAPAAIGAGEFIARFERDNPRFAELDAEVDAHRADATEASMWPNPTLSYEREVVFPDSGGVAENTLALGWSLDLSGRRSRRVTAARDRARGARARADRTELTATVAALESFYDAAHARLRAGALREGREPLARMVRLLAARVKQGDAAAYDLSRLELELAAYDERSAEAETELHAQRRVLGGLLGEPTVLYDARDDLALPMTPADPTALVTDAFTARGDYRATALDQASAGAALAAARRGWVPRVELGLGLKTADLGTEQALGYVAAIGMELPLFSRGQAETERAEAHRRAARARRAQLEREIPIEVRVARERLIAATAQANTFRTAQLDRARALVLKAETVYESGEGSVVELLDAYRTAVNARLRYLGLLRRARAAELSLSLALGRRPQGAR